MPVMPVMLALHWRRALLSGVLSAGMALLVVLIAPFGNMLSLAPVGVAAFGTLAPLVIERHCQQGPWLRPITWALLMFGVVLVVVPLTCVFAGFRTGVLPFLPSDRFLNTASLLYATAFTAFAIAQLRTSPKAVVLAVPSTALVRLAAVYTVLGILGVWFAFGSPQGIADYVRNPAVYLLLRSLDDSQNVQGLVANVLRPFFIVGAVAGWGAWRVHRASGTSRWERVSVLVAVVTGIIFVGATFNLNRNSIVVPLVAFAAAYMWTDGVVRAWLVGAAVAAVACGAVLVGQVRSVTSLAQDGSLLGNGLLSDDLLAAMQVYGGGPQYLGFLLESSAFEGVPFLGSTLLSSVLFPVPVLGKPWRETSGVALYNQLIYGDSSVADQIIPFLGELFINFHLVGVLLGFYYLGRVVLWLDVSLAKSRDLLGRYLFMYFGAWASFLILGSVAGVSQILVYFCWPLYGLALVSHVVRAPVDLMERAG
jgi:hypothetical protein